MRIYLADLGHNILTVSSDVYPLGVANLAAYLRQHLEGGERLDIRIFREPQDLKIALDDAPPHVLGLSNYSWNEALACHFAVYAKRRSAETLTCMGGPNFPLTRDVQASFLRDLPAIDVYVDGPTYEGERAFLNLIRRYRDVGQALDGIFDAPIPGSAWIDRRSDAVVRGETVERIRDLDEIPSPYLDGWMDPFFATGYFPLLQISRGCPFSCTFCNSGVEGNSKVYGHTVENVHRDLVYIAERVKPETTLCFADDNFGMYPRDEEIAEFIGWLQDRYGWPKYIRTTTGKNKGERIIRVMRKARGALPMTAAVQSMDPQVLRNIKRSNVKLETYRELQEELRRQGMQGYGELILCLPGETKATFMQAVQALLDAGVKRVSAHQLMLLHGAELATPESRARFGFDTRFRVVARNIGRYPDEPIVEVEEIVVATPTFGYQDYLETRTFHLLLTVFYYEGSFDEAFAWARQSGVTPFALVRRMHAMLGEAPPDFRGLVTEFLRESEEELFPTREACLAWARAHYEGLADGSIGGNLLSKYSMIGRFCATEAALDFLARAAAASLVDAGTSPEPDELAVVIEFLRAVLLRAPFSVSLRSEVRLTSRYDVEAWATDQYDRRLADYRYDEPRTFLAVVDPSRRALIEAKVRTFGEEPAGLGKFTRTMFAREMRRSLVPETDLAGVAPLSG